MSKNLNRVRFIDLDIDLLNKEQCFEKVYEYIKTDQYHYQISLNVAKLVYAQKDIKLKTVINNADIINADGMPVYIAAKLKSNKDISRMGGYDYIEGLSQRVPDLKYYFLGARQEVLSYVVSYVKDKYNVNVVGHRNGYFSMQELPEIIKEINGVSPDVLFLALGTPTKEYMLYDLRKKLNVKFAVGVGGAFDIIAEKTKRAPLIVQKVGMEWFYRLCQEPRRMWKRYTVTNTFFIYLLFKEYVIKKTLK